MLTGHAYRSHDFGELLIETLQVVLQGDRRSDLEDRGGGGDGAHRLRRLQLNVANDSAVLIKNRGRMSEFSAHVMHGVVPNPVEQLSRANDAHESVTGAQHLADLRDERNQCAKIDRCPATEAAPVAKAARHRRHNDWRCRGDRHQLIRFAHEQHSRIGLVWRPPARSRFRAA
jgi:hypothetical protein